MQVKIAKGTAYFHTSPDTASGVQQGVVQAERSIKVDAVFLNDAVFYTDKPNQVSAIKSLFKTCVVTVEGNNPMKMITVVGPIVSWGTLRGGFRVANDCDVHVI